MAQQLAFPFEWKWRGGKKESKQDIIIILPAIWSFPQMLLPLAAETRCLIFICPEMAGLTSLMAEEQRTNILLDAKYLRGKIAGDWMVWAIQNCPHRC